MKSRSTYNDEDFVKALKQKNRDIVFKCIKSGVLKQCPDEEKDNVYRQLFALRDRKIVKELAKQLDCFLPVYLKMDYSNLNNCQFIQEILCKYKKKFNLDDALICEEIFMISCAVRCQKIVQEFIRDERATEKYYLLGSAAAEIFSVLQFMDKNLLDDEEKIKLYYHAAVTVNGLERIQILNEWGYDLSIQTSKGESVLSMLKERMSSFQYPKNRTGEIQRKKDRATYYAIEKMVGAKSESELKKPSFLAKKKWIFCLIGIVCIGIMIGILVWSSEKQEETSDKTTEESSNEETEAGGTTETINNYSTESSLSIQDGDTVNIDYVGYIDGVAFEGGSTEGAGTDLTIGSGTYIDDFEEQLIGYHPGDSVSVRVTFPEDYSSEELAGKEAEFQVTVNGIYE